MTFDRAIEDFLTDKQTAGQITSPNSLASYRSRLNVLGEDVGNRDPRTIGREDIKRTLRRWLHPNTQSHARTVYVSFFDWCIEEGTRKDNPARQTRRPKPRATSVYRLSRGEVVALMQACRTRRERRAIYLGVMAGLRNAELCGLQLRHFKRAGAIWISPDIAKGGRQRFIPVLAELEEVVADIIQSVGEDDYVIAGRRPLGGHDQTTWREVPTLPSSPHALRALVKDVGQRAGIAAHIHPHLLRHAFGDHVARQVDVRIAQATLGHASVSTTTGTYTGAPTLDEVALALRAFRWAERVNEGPSVVERVGAG
jgi:integrase/recombinase XerC